MTDHVLTIDLGTSGPKVALFTMAATFVDGDFTPVELKLLPDGGAEQSPDAWWRGIVGGAATDDGARRACAPSDVTAVAVTSQWSGTVPIDRDGDPLHDAIIWMDSRGADDVKRAAGGPLRVQGYDPRKLRTGSSSPVARPRSRARIRSRTSCGSGASIPTSRAATWKYLEPKDWLNLKLTGRCAATFDSIVLHWITDNRDLARIDYDPGLLAHVRRRPRRSSPISSPATSVLGPLRDAIAVELGVPAGIPVVGGTPDLQSAAIGSGAVRDFEGHLYVGTSSWLTCHVPFKKTDLFHGIASLPSPLPGKYYVADEQEVAGASLNWLRDNVFFPDDALRAAPRARRLLPAARRRCRRPRRPGATA